MAPPLTFDPGRGDFLPTFADFVSSKYGVPLSPSDWPPQSLPAYLTPRVEVVDKQNKTVAAGRDAGAILASVEKRRDTRSHAWETTVQRCERHALSGWNFGDLPAAVDVEEVCGEMQRGYFGLTLRDQEVDLRLYRKADEADAASPEGIRRLAEKALAKDLAWLWKEMRNLAPAATPTNRFSGFQDALTHTSARLSGSSPAGASAFDSSEWLQDSACQHLYSRLTSFKLEPLHPLTQKRFEAMGKRWRRQLPARRASPPPPCLAQLYEHVAKN